MANLNFSSATNLNYSLTGDSTLASPLTGSVYGDGMINYVATASGDFFYNFTLYDMMSSGAMSYITVNGNYVGSATLYMSYQNLTGSTPINSGDTVSVYFTPGSDTSNMAYLSISSLYIGAAVAVDPYCVSGAGSLSVNGTYSFKSGSSGYYMMGYWEKVGDPSMKMGYNSMNSGWAIGLDYNDYYSSSSQTSGWAVSYSGTGPAPTVTAGECVTVAAAPTVTSISPTTGTTAGGTSITITGTDFTGATAVTIGGVAATNVTVVSATSITATTPVKTAGTASVLVTTSGGTNTANTLFTYTAPAIPAGVVSSLSNSGVGTLRQVITNINAGTATSPITFSVNGTITLLSDLPTLTKSMTITGPGISNLTIYGNNESAEERYKCFTLNSGLTFNISGLKIHGTGGYVRGGGIENLGSTLVVDSCYFLQCAASNGGGGIYTSGPTTITNSKFESCTAGSNSGGGVWTTGITTITNTSFTSCAASGGSGVSSYTSSQAITIGNCTFSSNSGVAFLSNSSSTVYNCTFSGNGGSYVGGIEFGGRSPSSLLSSTITGNTGTGASGVYLGEYVSLTLKNSIISGNTTTGGRQDFSSYGSGSKPIAFAAKNIIGVIPTGLAASADRVIGDPLLGPLQDNGGPTLTRAVGAGSVAINAGNAAASNAAPVNALDQRGTARSATTPTIGAVEYPVVSTPAPTVTSISPSSGPSTGVTVSVTITGTGFTGATSVTFAGVNAVDVTVVNDTTITATSPAGTAGSSSVLVTTPGGTNAANTLFTYIGPPVVTSISPNSGPSAGGTNVTITGTGLTGATAVTIGGVAATSITVVNSTSITATTPAGSVGTASVLVTTPGGTNAANTLFSYVAVPTVTSISPSSGAIAGGTSITITGTDFTGATAVTVKGVAATNITVVNSTTITATTPEGVAGTASVLVTTSSGTNTANTLFTFVPPYCVSGAGTNSINGTYFYADGVWVKDATTKLLYNTNGSGGSAVWAIMFNTNNEAYYNNSISSTPPLTSWLVSLALSPAPTLSVGSCISPTVSAISPASGSAAGGTNGTITGTNLTGTTSVTIGGTAVTNFTVISSTSITVTTPAGTAGTASVLVTTAGGTNAANTLFTYIAVPTVTSISPTSGTTAGSTNITITGTNLTGATAVTVGGTTATNITVVNSTTITATTPTKTAGTSSVLVTTPGGTSSANTLFTYVTPPPTVSAISPSSGTTVGGTTVTITGTTLTGATGVTLGGTAATGVTVVNSTTITATSPTNAAGASSVLVTTAAGTNSANSLFTYITPAPTPTPTSANTIRIKRSSTTATNPITLLEGELASNIYDRKLWIGSSDQTPVLLSDITANFSNRGAWDYNTTYDINSVVEYAGVLYFSRSTVPPYNTQPNVNPTYWTVLSNPSGGGGGSGLTNLDGGVASSVYLLTQNITGGNANGV